MAHRCAVLGNINYIRHDKAGRYVGEGCSRSAVLLFDTRMISDASSAAMYEFLGRRPL